MMIKIELLEIQTIRKLKRKFLLNSIIIIFECYLTHNDHLKEEEGIKKKTSRLHSINQ